MGRTSPQSLTIEAHTVAAAAGWVSFAATCSWLIDLLTRPPCPENFVRLLDVELALPPLCLILAGVSRALFKRIRRRSESRPLKKRSLIGGMVLLFVGALLL